MYIIFDSFTKLPAKLAGKILKLKLGNPTDKDLTD
jgi:hypothetical protein